MWVWATTTAARLVYYLVGCVWIRLNVWYIAFFLPSKCEFGMRIRLRSIVAVIIIFGWIKHGAALEYLTRWQGLFINVLRGLQFFDSRASCKVSLIAFISEKVLFTAFYKNRWPAKLTKILLSHSLEIMQMWKRCIVVINRFLVWAKVIVDFWGSGKVVLNIKISV